MNYQNFDLEIISSQGEQGLRARVLQSPQGDSPFIDVAWPFEADEENEFLAEIYGGLRQRRARTTKMSTIQDFGGRLFDAVFTGDIEHLFRSSLDTACRSGNGLRIRLRLPDDSAVQSQPWEFLFDTERREFLSVREHTPLVRYLPVAQPTPPITVEGPLRILVALAAPTDHPRLDVAREWEILMNALEAPVSAGQVELRRVPGRCTFDNLRDSLRHFGAHIFHFVGHGIPGALVLEQESGKGLEMEAAQLRSAFPGDALPRLIVLNACSGAIDEGMPFSGLAQGFLRQGVPAVVAMQASITDDAALIFTRYFYRDLIESGTVDASLTEARLRMQGNGHPIEWGTPVLYMRAMSGQLFRPGANPGERKTPKEAPTREYVPPRPEHERPRRPKEGKEGQARDGTSRPRPEPPQTGRKWPKEPPKRDNPPIKTEPYIDKPAMDREIAARAPPPSRPEPKPGIPDVPVTLPPRPVGNEKDDLVKLLIRYWPVASLVAFSMVATAGLYMVFHNRPTPAPARPSATSVPAAPPLPSSPATAPHPGDAAQTVVPPPVKPTTGAVAAKGTGHRTHPSARRKTVTQEPVRNRAAPAVPDNCNNPDVNARPVDCVLKK